MSNDIRDAALRSVTENGLALKHLQKHLRGDEEIVLAAIAQNPVALQYASDDLRDDAHVVGLAIDQSWVALECGSARISDCEEIVRRALALSGLALKDASERLRADEDIVFAALKNDGMALAYASEELRNRPDVVMAAIEQNPAAFEYASSEVKGDYEVVCPVLRADGSMLRFTSDRICSDRDVVLDAVTNYGMALCWANEMCKDDLEVVSAAVAECGTALAYASERLRGDDRVVRAASRQDANALEYASLELRNDKEIIQDILERDGLGLKWAADLRDDDEMVATAVDTNGMALAEASARLRRDKKIVLRSVRQDGRSLLFASADLRGDNDVVLASVSQHGGALAHALEPQLQDFEICRAALAQDGMALTFVPANLREVREVVVSAVTQKGASLVYAPYEMKGDPEVALAAVNEGGKEAVELLSLDLKRDPVFVEFALSECPKIPGVLENLPWPRVRKYALAKARRYLEPIVKEFEISWLEALPTLQLIRPLSDLEEAFSDPEGFIVGLDNRSAVVVKSWAIVRLRPVLEKYLREKHIEWMDMLLVLDPMPANELMKIFEDPQQFLQDLSKTRVGVPVKRYFLAQLRRYLVPLLPEGLDWEDVYLALDAIETPKEVQDFLDGAVDLLYWKLKNGGVWAPALVYSKVLLRLTVHHQLPADPLPRWPDFWLVILELSEREELAWAMADWRRFFLYQKMDPYTRTAKLWALAQLRPRIEPMLEREGTAWQEILPVLEEMDTMKELQPALEGDIGPFVKKLALGPELRAEGEMLQDRGSGIWPSLQVE